METPATRTTLHRLILLVVLLVTAYVTARYADVRFTGEAGVRRELPEQVGAWRGQDLFYCQTMTCQWSYTRSELGEDLRCRRCNGEVSQGSPVEWSLLPRDTTIIKKLYQRDGYDPLSTAVVLSGANRTSIHRPQICLVGGGQEIVATHTRRITLADGSSFKLVVLDLLRRGTAENGQTFAQERFFAYWFSGPNRVTSSHWARMFWMGFERIFLGVSHRWAYLSVSGQRDGDRHLVPLDEFVRDFYPLVVQPTSAP